MSCLENIEEEKRKRKRKKPLLSNAKSNLLPVKIEGSKVYFGIDGAIRVDGKELGELQIMWFKQPEQLQKMGSSYWAASSKSQQPVKSEDIALYQGMLEGSNVNIVKAMVDLITTNRNYGAIHKAIQAMDQLDEKSLSMTRV